MTMTRVIAHRGSSAEHPENSWSAFEAAIREGADVIECDAQMTRDGVLIVRHDLTINDRLIADVTVAELEAEQPAVVRLDELIEWAPGFGIDLLVELKDPDAAAAVGRAVAASPWRRHIVVGAFHGPAIATVKAVHPGISTSLMMGSVVGPEDLIVLARAHRADEIHPCWESRAPRPHRLLDRTAVQRLREAGLKITLWHEERESELIALVALRPDAICTNTPKALRRILEARAANGSPMP